METPLLCSQAAADGKEKEKKKKPLSWIGELSKEMDWSFVFGVVVVNGINQGLGGAVGKVASDYYWKDVQKVQPSEAQVYQGICSLPWIVKPLWGLLTDVLPVAGYKRKPYFILAGLVGVVSMIVLSLNKELGVAIALLSMMTAAAGAAITDVTMDACITENSISHPSLTADMQSLCGLTSSIGGLLGFSISGLLLHAIGPQGVFRLLIIPAALVFSVGMVLKELHRSNFVYKQVYQKVLQTKQTMWTALKCPDVWRTCVYSYIMVASNLSIHEGMFYWFTDPMSGPAFSQTTVGFIFSIGSVGSLLGVLLYQSILKNHSFRNLILWSQLLSSFSGMLDLIIVLRLNLKIGIPDYVFIMIDEMITQTINRVKLMPILVLSSRLCPSGVEGTFFALLMAIHHVGALSSSSGGGILLHVLKITRTEFDNLWAAILIRCAMRLLPLALIYLVPNSDQHSPILPANIFMDNEEAKSIEAEAGDINPVSLHCST